MVLAHSVMLLQVVVFDRIVHHNTEGNTVKERSQAGILAGDVLCPVSFNGSTDDGRGVSDSEILAHPSPHVT